MDSVSEEEVLSLPRCSFSFDDLYEEKACGSSQPGTDDEATPVNTALSPRSFSADASHESINATALNVTQSRSLLFGNERALVVHLVSHDNPDLLVGQARGAIPAICNFMYFGGATVAVVYLGKRRTSEGKLGIDNATALKRLVLRMLTVDIWPPLRIDVPDDHENHNLPFSQNSMHALVYTKSSNDGKQYLKIVLRSTGKLYFDNVESEDEKLRWENRKLSLRMLDSLETKSSSFEEYLAWFQQACLFSSQNRSLVEQQRSTIEVVHHRHDTTRYSYFATLREPESVVLDYKSYYPDATDTLIERGCKFSCGFINALGFGKLVVGVHELRNFGGSGGSGGEDEVGTPSVHRTPTTGGNSVSQVVVGHTYSPGEITRLVQSLSQQMRACVPPLPPKVVRLSIWPVKLPVDTSRCVVILYETVNRLTWRDTFRQKVNILIRELAAHRLSVCEIDASHVTKQFSESVSFRVLQCFAVIPIDPPLSKLSVTTPEDSRVDPDAAFGPLSTPLSAVSTQSPSSTTHTVTPASQTNTQQHQDVSFPGTPPMRPATTRSPTLASTAASKVPRSPEEIAALTTRFLDTLTRGKAQHAVLVLDEAIPVPSISVLELSADIARAGAPWTTYAAKGGKFFNGWPSIPLWNIAVNGTRRVERDYEIFSTKRRVNVFGKVWFDDATIVSSVVAFLRQPQRPPGVGRAALGRNEERQPWSSFERPSPTSAGGPGPLPILSIAVATPTTVQRSSSPAGNDFGGSPRGGWMRSSVFDRGLPLRRISSVFNVAIEKANGRDFVNLVGQLFKPPFRERHEVLQRLQLAFQRNRVPCIPLLLAWVYESLGALPAPFPYCSVPLTMQGMRPEKQANLIPVFFRAVQPPSPAVSTTAVVMPMLVAEVFLDTDDGLLKIPVTRGSASGFSYAAPATSVQTSRSGMEPLLGVHLCCPPRVQPQQWNHAPPQSEHQSQHLSARRSRAPAATRVEFRFVGASSNALGSLPWSLSNLLLWVHEVLNDRHVKRVGTLRDQFAFFCNLQTDACPSHLTDQMPGVSPITESGHRYPTSFDCIMHHCEQKWVQWT